MKYILKKDLPFAKAGCELKDNLCVVDSDGRDRYLANWNEDKDHCINRLLKDGWIEEVKPREFYVGLYEDGGIAYIGDESCKIGNFIKKILKVREVIE